MEQSDTSISNLIDPYLQTGDEIFVKVRNPELFSANLQFAFNQENNNVMTYTLVKVYSPNFQFAFNQENNNVMTYTPVHVPVSYITKVLNPFVNRLLHSQIFFFII